MSGNIQGEAGICYADGRHCPGRGTFVINRSGAFMMGLLSTLMGIDWRDCFGSLSTARVLTGLHGGNSTLQQLRIGKSGPRSPSEQL